MPKNAQEISKKNICRPLDLTGLRQKAQKRQDDERSPAFGSSPESQTPEHSELICSGFSESRPAAKSASQRKSIVPLK